MKRFTKLLLTVAMLVSVSLSTFAERFSYTFAGQTVYYERTENYTARVDYCPVTVSGGVAIPDEVAYQGAVWGPVTAVASNAFEDCINITAVSLPASVTSIGAGAFKNCTSLTSVMLTASNKRVDFSWYAFYGCSDEVYNSYDNALYIGTGANPYLYLMKAASTNITSCQIHPDCKYINGDAFRNCDKLTEISIPNTITYIGSYAFSGCSALASLTLSSNVTSIGKYAFDGCSSLTTVTVPRSVTSIGFSAFGGCSALESITLPFVGNAANADDFEQLSGAYDPDYQHSQFGYVFGTTSYEGGTATVHSYWGVNEKKTYYIPSSLKTVTIDAAAANDVAILYGAFSNCTELTSITLNQVTSIGEESFEGCTSLTTITVPKSVTSIARGAFYKCSALESMTLPFPGTQKYTPAMVETELAANNGEVVNGNTGDVCGFLFCSIFRGKIPSSLRTVTFTNCEYLPYNTFYNGPYSDSGFSTLTSVTLPNNLTTIGEKVFSYCSGLTSVTIPNYVTTVGDSAFYKCTRLEEIEFPNAVTQIGSYALSGCTGLTSVTMSESVTSISEHTFDDCRVLTSITIPEGVTSIGSHAFYQCYDLTSVIIPESVTSIGESAFEYCSDVQEFLFESETPPTFGKYVFSATSSCPIYVPTLDAVTAYRAAGNMSDYASRVRVKPIEVDGIRYQLQDDGTFAVVANKYSGEIVIPSSIEYNSVATAVTSIGNSAFSGRTDLTSVTIPSSITSIGNSAFYGCTGLTSVTIPSNVTSIGSSAFEDCTGLTSVTIPESVMSIGEWAFEDCSNVQEFVFEGETPPTFGRSVFSGSSCPIYVPTVDAVTAYKAVEIMSYYASRIQVKPIEVDGVRYQMQEDGTFAIVANNYSGEFVIPSSIEYNGVATAVTSIGKNAFNGCTGLTAVTIPSSITSMGTNAFSGCTSLTKVTLNSNAIASKTYTSSSNLGTKFGQQVTEYVLGEDVTSIGDYAFYGCTGLPLVNIPEGVSSVGNNAFYGCTGLTSITINSNAALSGAGLYFIKDGIKYKVLDQNSVSVVANSYSGEVAIPEKVTFGNTFDITTIAANAFKDCTDLTAVTVPSYVTSIGSDAFNGCTSLTKVTINSNAIASKTYTSSSNFKTIFGNQVTEYVFDEDVTKIGNDVFYGCTGLTSVTIPEGVTEIGDEVFDGCSNLTAITIPEGVTSIGKDAFYGCKGLTSVNIPKSVTSIGDYAFGNCSNVQEFIFEGETPPTFGRIVFVSSSCPIYVPTVDAVTAYKAADNMSNYASRVAIMPTFVVVDGIKYQLLNDGTFAVAANNYSGEVVIPSSIDYNGVATAVTSIAANAFKDCTGLTAVTIPGDITSIGRYAFSGCTGLSNVTIPSSVTSIESDAFSGCTSLTKVILNSNAISSKSNYSSSYNLGTIFGTQVTEYVLGEDVTSIGNYAFDGCTNLTRVTINSNAITSKTYTWKNNLGTIFGTQVTEYVLGEDVTSIGDYAFDGCTGLTSIIIPEGVTSVGEEAFYGCKGLTSVTIPEGVMEIGSGAFGNCTNLTKVTLNSNAIASMSNSEWYSPIAAIFGSQVTEYVLGEGVTSLSDIAFYNCTNLKSVTISKNVTSIGTMAFYDCRNAQEFVFEGETPPTFGSDLVFEGSSCPIFVPTSEAATAYKVAKNMSRYASRVQQLVEVDGFKYQIQEDGTFAVRANNYSGDVVIPSSVDYNGVTTAVTAIAASAFKNCTDLTSVNIPSSITSIGNNAFDNCSDLTSITIPEGVTSIGSDAFKGCTGLTAITINSNTNLSGAALYFIKDGIKYQVLDQNTVSVVANSYLDEIAIPENVTYGNKFNVTSIADYAFYNCTGLTSVTIPESVTEIGSSAFYNCKKLTSVTIPKSVTSIKTYAFEGCTGLASVTISEGVRSISYAAFKGCTGLTSVTIPSSVTSLSDAFTSCTNLTKVTLDSKNISKSYTKNTNLGTTFGNQVTEYVFVGEDVTSIGKYAFYGCKGLTSMTIPESVTSIGEYAFYGCTGLTSITIPEGVTSIGGYALGDCIHLTSVTIPESVTSINYYAFYNCSNTQEFVFEGETPPTFGTKVFYYTNGNSPIYVPNESAVTAYQSANNMSNYADRVQVNPIHTIAVVANNDEYGTVSGGGTYDVRVTPTVTISATAIEPYQFAYWNEDGNTEATRTITITENATYTAVFKRAITISNISAAEKVYDGTTAAQINYTTDGILEGDDVTIEPTATFADKNVSENIAVTYSFAMSGEDAENYVLAFETVDLKANIIAKSIAISNITAGEKVYDGESTATLTFELDGVLENDEVEVSYTANFADKNVGDDKAVTYSFAKSGEDAENYVLAFETVDLKANITAKSIAISNITAGEKVYDGETTATLAFELEGILENDEVEVSYTANFADKNVGEDKAVTFNFAKSGADEANYELAVEATEPKAAITAYTSVEVTITENSGTETYDGTEKTVTGYTVEITTELYTESDFAFNGTAEVKGTNAGEYEMNIVASDFENTNANFTDVKFTVVDGKLTIEKSSETPNMPELTAETRLLNITDVALPEGWAWADETIVLEEGENSAVANYVGDDAGNYTVESVTITITRLPCLHDGEYTIVDAQEATCTADGYTGDHKCSICGAIFEQGSVIPAKGHKAGEPVIENYIAPTCKEAGSVDTVYYCTIDGDLISRETYVLPIVDHVPGKKVAENIIPATTTTEGSVDSVVYCMVGGEELSREHFVLPILDHEHIAGKPVVENYVAPTCTEAGAVDTVVYCTVNGEELSREHFVLPALGHTAGEAVVENYVAPTCTEAGTVDTVYYCTIDNEEISRETYVLEAKGHQPSEKVAKNYVAPTCLVAGSVDSVVTCTVCGEILSEEHFVLPALGHTAGEAVVENYTAPTCKEAGSVDTVYYCTIDGEEISRETYVLPMLEHVAGKKVAENIIPATTTTEGSVDSVVYCMVGGEELSREHFVLPILDHEHIAGEPVVENYVAPTCTEAGAVDTVVYCTVNGEELSREHYVLPAPGHQPSEKVAKNYVAPTCLVAGSVDSVITCMVCGEILSEEHFDLPATGHTAGEPVVENYTAPTCTTTGTVDTVYYCTIDGEEISRETYVLPMLEHVAGEKVAENYVAPTFTAEGSVDSVVYCTIGGEELSRETFELPMLQKAIEKIEVLSMPKTEYVVGEDIDITGAKISVTFNDGSVEEIDLTNEMLSGFDNTLVAEQDITVTYLTFTTTIHVTVNETTAVPDIATDVTSIYAYGHTIVVETTLTGDIIVNDVNGRIVAKSQSNGDRTEIYVPKVGVYAVRIGTVSQKVVVR